MGGDYFPPFTPIFYAKALPDPVVSCVTETTMQAQASSERSNKSRHSRGAVKKGAIPASLTHFSSLPDDAYVRVDTVAALFSFSVATAWRKAKAGEIPAPRKLSDRVTAWRVGDLRAALADAGQGKGGGNA